MGPQRVVVAHRAGKSPNQLTAEQIQELLALRSEIAALPHGSLKKGVSYIGLTQIFEASSCESEM